MDLVPSTGKSEDQDDRKLEQEDTKESAAQNFEPIEAPAKEEKQPTVEQNSEPTLKDE